MIYNIPEWPADSNVNHTVTTWVLARDENFANIEDRLDESGVQLLVWEIDKIIPTGEVWYIKALRKLEDEDGNDLNNTKWIGPKPVFSEESSVNEYLAPKFYIDTPYITDVIYKDGESLEIKVTPYKTNVGYVNTVLTIENAFGDVLLTKFYDLNDTENSLLIETAELDFTDLNDVKITIAHNGTQSTMSSPVTEIINLKNAHFNITGNSKDLDPTYINKLKVVSTTFNGATATAAVLKNRLGEVVETINILNNELLLKNNLEFNKEYLLEVTVQYAKADGSLDTTTKVVIITTRDSDEIVTMSDNVTYNDNFVMTSSTEYGTNIYNYDLDKSFNTEEFFTYSIPVPDNNSNNISLFGLDKELMMLSKHVDNIITLNKEFSIRLLTKTKGIITTLDSNNIVIVTPFTFDPYTDNITLQTAITTGFVSTTAFVNKIVQQSTGVFIAGIDKDDKTLLKVKEYDLTARTLTDKYT